MAAPNSPPRSRLRVRILAVRLDVDSCRVTSLARLGVTTRANRGRSTRSTRKVYLHSVTALLQAHEAAVLVRSDDLTQSQVCGAKIDSLRGTRPRGASPQRTDAGIKMQRAFGGPPRFVQALSLTTRGPAVGHAKMPSVRGARRSSVLAGRNIHALLSQTGGWRQ